MHAMRMFAFLFLVVLASTTPIDAQEKASAPQPQTPKQALLEIIHGGQSAVMKHLTVDVQQLLAKPENKSATMGLAMFDAFKAQAGGDLQTFETGPVLLAVNEPRQHQKFEIRVENDDLNGDQDTLDLSLHETRDGQEQRDELGFFSTRISVIMNSQQDVWPLSSIKMGFEIPVGNAEFLQQTFLKPMNSAGVTSIGVNIPQSTADGMTGMKVGAEDALPQHETTFVLKPADMPPELLVVVLGMAETSFAKAHTDVGFTCSLADLAGQSSELGIDHKISSGVYNGYKINLAGCQGKPAGSFQISLKPASSGAAGKAYCVDATQNVRVSDDGRGATCLVSGRP